MESIPVYLWAGLFLLVIGSVSGGGCRGEEKSAYGAWTMLDHPLSLSEELRVSEAESFFFATIIGLDVTSEGRIAVADQGANNIKLLRPNGTLLATLGREGEGPGEFQLLVNVSVARGDSLYAVDALQNRLVVFSPAPPHAVVRTARYTDSRKTWILDRGRLSWRSGRSREDPYNYICRDVGKRGDPDTLLRVRPQTTREVPIEGGGRLGWRVPFAPRPEFDRGRDRLYYGRTDSLHVEAYAIDGSSEQVVSVPTPSSPVREADRDSALRDIENPELRAKVATAIPDTKPAFTNLVVADDGRLWVQRSENGPTAETVAWWVLDPDTKTIREVRLPANVDLEVVRDGKAYGTTQTKMGAPAVVRYRIES